MPDGIVKKDDQVKIQEAGNFYTSFIAYTRYLFTRVTDKNALEINSISQRVKMVWNTVRYDRRFLMRVHHHTEHTNDENYIASHSARATIIAMIIGTYFKLPNHRLVELGTATLLHDIGMFMLPPRLYMSGQALSDQEKKLLYTHPVQGYKILQSHNYPPSICLAVLEHHERENGSGYPRSLTGDSISQYGKIIAVACSYDALSAKRPHKEAKDHHTGIMELLNNEGRRYDSTVVRALVYSLSIYPIGSYVFLSSSEKGQVVDVNPENPRYPIVQILETPKPWEKNRTVQTSYHEVSIVRLLTPEEISVLTTSNKPPLLFGW